jgi:hypothetical protein
VKLHEVPDDGEAEAEAAVLSTRRAVRLPEALEHVREKPRVDARAVVLHANLDLVATVVRQGHLDETSGPREFDRVGDEVPDDLLQALRIAINRDR